MTCLAKQRVCMEAKYAINQYTYTHTSLVLLLPPPSASPLQKKFHSHAPLPTYSRGDMEGNLCHFQTELVNSFSNVMVQMIKAFQKLLTLGNNQVRINCYNEVL